MRAATALGQLALAVALGALVVGYGVVLPLLDGGTELVDANLARAIIEDIALRLGLVITGACGLLVISARAWTQSRLASSLALCAFALAGIDRFILMPRMYQAWSRVDMVAMRPLDRVAEAGQLTNGHYWVLLAVALALVGVAFLTPRRSSSVESTPEPRLERPAPMPAAAATTAS